MQCHISETGSNGLGVQGVYANALLGDLTGSKGSQGDKGGHVHPTLVWVSFKFKMFLLQKSEYIPFLHAFSKVFAYINEQ